MTFHILHAACVRNTSAGSRHKVTNSDRRRAFVSCMLPAASRALASVVCAVVVSLLLATAAHAQDDTVNLSTTIRGNQEQPKVLYIVPWKAVDDSELENQTIQSQLDIVFGHVERVELQRELTYLKNLTETEKQKEE